MPTSKNAAIAKIQSLPSPTEQLRELAAFISRGEAALQEARAIRDALITDIRSRPKRPTIDALADATGINRHTIVEATRGK
jgi:hypothetical protein